MLDVYDYEGARIGLQTLDHRTAAQGGWVPLRLRRITGSLGWDSRQYPAITLARSREQLTWQEADGMLGDVMYILGYLGLRAQHLWGTIVA
jgi:hypothetical protein